MDEIYQLALAALRHHLNEAQATYRIDDGEIVIDHHRLGLSIAFDGFVQQGEQVIAPVDIQIHLDGDQGDRFRMGTLGIGDTHQVALQAAIAEWHLLAVAPLLAALDAPLETRQRPKHPPRLAGWDLFAGRAGIRGRLPAALNPGGALYRDLLDVLRRATMNWEMPEGRQEFHSVFLLTSFGPEVREIQAAVDGYVNEPLATALAALPWPVGEETYLYKQLFVFRAGADA